MGNGYRLEWMGSSGSYGRKLVRIKLTDVRYAGKPFRALVDSRMACEAVTGCTNKTPGLLPGADGLRGLWKGYSGFEGLMPMSRFVWASM
jgi:hypothetical protein